MVEPVRNSLILGAVLLALSVVGWARWRGWAAMVLAAASVVLGLSLGVLVAGDALYLPQLTGLWRESCLLLLAPLYGLLLRRAGPPRLSGHPALVAPLLGALMGEVSAAAVLGAVATDRRSAARLAMAAAGGAFFGRVADPGLLILGERDPRVALALAPLGLLLVGLAAPRRDMLQSPAEGRVEATWIAALVALGAIIPGGALPALGLGCVACALLLARRDGWKRPRLQLGTELLWGAGSVVLVLVATAAGVSEFAAYGLEQAADYLGQLPLALLTGAGGLVSLLIGAPASALLSAAALDRALDLLTPGRALALAAGVAAGGLGPLVAARAVRAGLLRWIVGVVVAALYVALLGRFL